MVRIRLSRKRTPKNQAQMELDFGRPQEQDRNFHLGGRSFYFFDFDDNVAYLTTPIIVFNKKTGTERTLSSGEWARYHHTIGHSGPFENYYVDYNDESGSFRYFRDQKHTFIDKVVRRKQTFLSDIEKALEQADYSWKAPSWNCFYHAIYNGRPTSVITARGHNKETIQEGIDLMVRQGHLPHNPNYLSIYPVTNPNVRINELEDPNLQSSVADLKRAAIRQSVEKAIKVYGMNPHHRFGMSDDDPKNVELITEEMKCLKKVYPEMAFFVIQTFEDSYVKTEILETRTRDKKKGSKKELPEQLTFL
ncbi:MAG: hypothetical protein NXH75_12570 [Halobacteriovoraceae bacterium]|nr:hypothetical protein [Halobacteriovoraceae bacterium]